MPSTRIWLDSTRGILCIAMALALLLFAGSVDLRASQQAPAQTSPAPPAVWVVALDGAITPAAAAFVHGALRRASEQQVALVVLRMDTPGGGISPALLIGFAAVSACFLVAVLGIAVRARRRPVVSGQEELIGLEGELIEVDDRAGYAQVHGERWRVTSDLALAPGQP